MAVHGAYVVRIGDADAAATSPCLRYLLAGSDSTLRVTQSGAQLAATLGPEKNVALRGMLNGDRVRLAGPIDEGSVPDSVACAPGDSLTLTGRSLRDTVLKRIDGTAATSCVTCAAVSIVALRPRGYPGRRRS